MKKDIVHLVYALTAIVACSAVEELLPQMFAVGWPVLLSAAAYCSVRRPPIEGFLFAVAAGAAEDSLSSLPVATSLSFFVGMFALLRGLKLPLVFALPAYCFYQLWLWIWLGSALDGSVMLRFMSAIPVGAVALVAVAYALEWLDGKAAMDEK